MSESRESSCIVCAVDKSPNWLLANAATPNMTVGPDLSRSLLKQGIVLAAAHACDMSDMRAASS